MKFWLIFVFATAVALSFYLFELHLVDRFKPEAAALEQTTSVSGKLYFVSNYHRDPWHAEINGVRLECKADYLSPNTNCTELVEGLRAGAEVTAAMAYVYGTLQSGYVAMSIAVNGQQVYSRTPRQFIENYTQVSYRHLLGVPFCLLLICFFLPWFYFSGAGRNSP